MNTYKDNLALNVFGRSRTLAIAGAQCVSCGRPAVWFRDQLSRKEFTISGLCQTCQNDIFDDPSMDEGD